MITGDTSELSDLSTRVIEEEDIITIQLGTGLYFNKYYSIYLMVSYVIIIASKIMMISGCYTDGKIVDAFENAHITIIIVNSATSMAAYWYNSEVILELFRAINKNFYSYGDTMDNTTTEEIDEVIRLKMNRKKLFCNLFKLQIIGAVLGLILKRLVLYLINGSGTERDGRNGLIYASPTGIYFPYAELWIPYIIGWIMCFNIIYVNMATAMAITPVFIRFTEEFCAQINIIKLGLRHINRRSHHLYFKRYGKSYDENDASSYTKFTTCLKKCLDESIKHHILIIKMFDKYKRLFSVIIFTVIVDGGILLCMSAVLCLKDYGIAVKLTMPFFILVELYYTYIYCGYGEQLTNLFADVGRELYQDDLIRTGYPTKPYIMLIRRYTYLPKKLTGLGFTSPNHESFLSVLQGAYSFLNFLMSNQSH